MAKNVAVFGLYATPYIAESAVEHLVVGRGFDYSNISVMLSVDESTHALGHEKHTKAPEGTAAGAATGGVIGGTLGLLAGIGALAVPGIGPLLAAGPILSALAGLGAGGAVGGIVGALVGMGIPEYEAKRFEGAIKNGGTLLSVHCETPDEITRAKQALKETGAQDIAASGEESSRNEPGTDDELRNAYLKHPVPDSRVSHHAGRAGEDAMGDYELKNAYMREDADRAVDFDLMRGDVSEMDPFETGADRESAQDTEHLAGIGSSATDARNPR